MVLATFGHVVGAIAPGRVLAPRAICLRARRALYVASTGASGGAAHRGGSQRGNRTIDRAQGFLGDTAAVSLPSTLLKGKQSWKHSHGSGEAEAGRAATVGVAVVMVGTVGGIAADAASPPPAHLNNGTVGLKQVGPIDETNGFPLWYKDTNNVRLELCLDPSDANCIMGALPNPGQPVSFPDNFPDEGFWSNATATLDAGGGDKALLVTGVEAAFGTADGLPAPGGQISFGRIRIRAAGLVDGATYTVTNPYGVDHIDAEAGAVKGINTTEDIGSLTPNGTFDQTLAAKSAPFLKWPTGAPAGYLGDPTVDHVVTGSPFNTNFFRIEGPVGSFTGSTQLCADATLGDSATATDDCIETDLFSVVGKIATRAGVEVTKAYYSNSGTGHMMDLFAFSEPGQNLVVSGSGIPQTRMREDASSGRLLRPGVRRRRTARGPRGHQQDGRAEQRRPRGRLDVRRQGAHHRRGLQQRRPHVEGQRRLR